MCLHSNLLGWHNVPIAKIVERVTGMPTYIDNDAHAVALGQKLFGLARELKSFMVVMLGKKIGGGSYMQGRLYRGHTGAAGEKRAAWKYLPPAQRCCEGLRSLT
jgi:predicted NBD/HSP70 family sugar kinase